jgi:hypothetical protein
LDKSGLSVTLQNALRKQRKYIFDFAKMKPEATPSRLQSPQLPNLQLSNIRRWTANYDDDQLQRVPSMIRTPTNKRHNDLFTLSLKTRTFDGNFLSPRKAKTHRDFDRVFNKFE